MIFRFLRRKIVSGVVLVSSSSLISPAVDHLADLALWEAELATGDGGADAWSVTGPLVQRLRQVPDPRRARGRRHPLEGEPEITRLDELLADPGRARHLYTGVSVNLLTMRPEICVLLLVRDPGWLREESHIARKTGRPFRGADRNTPETRRRS